MQDEEGELHAVQCVVGQNWVVTSHDQPISVLDDFASREEGQQLAKAFMRITRPAIRLRIVALVREVAGDDGE